MPELRLVVLALQDRLAYGADVRGRDGRRCSAAPCRRWRRAPNAPEPPPARRRSTHRATAAGTPRRASRADAQRVDQRRAAKDLADYQRLTAEGKLGEAGQKLDALKQKLEQLNARKR